MTTALNEITAITPTSFAEIPAHMEMAARIARAGAFDLSVCTLLVRQGDVWKCTVHALNEDGTLKMLFGEFVMHDIYVPCDEVN